MSAQLDMLTPPAPELDAAVDELFAPPSREGPLRFFVPGTPKPKGTLISGVTKDGRRFQRNLDKGHGEWRAKVGHVALGAMAGSTLLEGPVRIALTFFVLRPKGHFGTGKHASLLKPGMPLHPAGKPDVDKLMRAVGDALTGVCYRDDAQITTADVRKRYGDKVGVLVELAPDGGHV
jgi:crossover junction endodeoxyribonuclease RusA